MRLIQIEPSLSRTASRAWQWIPLHERSEAGLAAGLTRVLLDEHLVAAQGPMPQLSLADVTAQTGLSVEAIRSLARTMRSVGPLW